MTSLRIRTSKAIKGGCRSFDCLKAFCCSIPRQAGWSCDLVKHLSGTPVSGRPPCRWPRCWARCAEGAGASASTDTSVCADLAQNGLLMTHVVGLFAKDQPIQSTWQTLTAPVAPPWQDVEVLDMNHSFAPEFTRHFEFRTLGPLPYSNSPESNLGYLRPHTRVTRRDAGHVCALIDVWWLAASR